MDHAKRIAMCRDDTRDAIDVLKELAKFKQSEPMKLAVLMGLGCALQSVHKELTSIHASLAQEEPTNPEGDPHARTKE